MTQTMTKEQILDRNGFDFDAFQLENEYSAKAILKSMSEWEQQQLSAERERAGKLVEALKMCLYALCNNKDERRIYNKAYKSLTEYINQGHTNPSS